MTEEQTPPVEEKVEEESKFSKLMRPVKTFSFEFSQDERDLLLQLVQQVSINPIDDRALRTAQVINKLGKKLNDVK